MKNRYVVFLLSLALAGCENNKVRINDFTFYIDGVHYDLSSIPEERVRASEICVNGYRYSDTSPLDSLRYFFSGYNATSMNGAYGGQIYDRSAQKETVFEVPDMSSTDTFFWTYFWIRINNRTYDAVSGYMEIINETNLENETGEGSRVESYFKMHGTFDFVMVNRDDELDTIHVTNGKFKYQRYDYWQTYTVRN